MMVIASLRPLLLTCLLGLNIVAVGHLHVSATSSTATFVINGRHHHSRRSQAKHRSGRVQPNAAKAKPRKGFAQQLLDLALASPVWEYVLVPQAWASIVKTGEENGIPWVAAKEWLNNQKDAPWSTDDDDSQHDNIQYPDYYRKSFHAYSDGKMSYDAAFEQELASRSIGARNFPKYSSGGEDVFRGAFDQALSKMGTGINCIDNGEDAVIVDFGCGTGTSTRRMAKQYPQATQLIGIDLSPYFIDVGQTLLKLAPSAIDVADNDNKHGGWITTIESDTRIQLSQGDIANTKLPSNSASVVNVGLVLHELPVYAAKQVILEAHRILQPGGQLWISEMDFQAPAYKAQRENYLLFSLLLATEPYLDDYADGMPEVRNFIAETFEVVKITAATGRHYALLAEKSMGKDDIANRGSKQQALIEDNRFQEDRSYAIEDTQLKPWESKEYIM